MEQFELFFKHDSETLRRWLEKETRFALRLTVTDNSTRMLSVRKVGGLLSVRLHRVFLDAPPDVLREAALFIKRRRGATPLINGYIRSKRESIKEGRPKRIRTKTLGAHHDLLRIFDSINSEYFDGAITSSITWGAAAARGSVRRRTLGSYGYAANIIRINPLLDDKRVPDYFVAFVVYHEMLHAHIGVETKSGRRSIHPKEFREREKLFKDYRRATEWEKTNRV